ncbi:MAG: hypothetical protein Q7S57_03395 [bacterium]|nr:hypothetical protein [bacterium]
MSPVLLVASLLFAIVLLFFVIYGFFLVYHLFEFSLNKTSSLILVAVFVGVSILLLFTIFIYLAQVNWSGPLFSFFQI